MKARKDALLFAEDAACEMSTMEGQGSADVTVVTDEESRRKGASGGRINV